MTDLKRILGDFSFVKEQTTSIAIPEKWRALLILSKEEGLRYVISLWRMHFEKELSVLLDTFERRLISVQLIELDAEAALLYTLQKPDEEYIYYVGYAPVPVSETVEVISGVQLPDRFSCFYRHIHNGWYEAETQAVGLMPFKDLFWLADKEWGILDDITVDLALDKILAVFSNGAGGYLCWNFNSDEPSGLVWWDDEEPDSVDFWDILDEWTAMGINDY